MTQDIRPKPYPHGQPFMNSSSSSSSSSILSSAVGNSNINSSSILSSADRSGKSGMSAVRFHNHNANNQQQRRRLRQSASCSPFNSSRVSFGTISILEFPTIIGDNPVVHDGCPIALGPYPILPSSSAVSVNNNNSTSIMTSKKNRNRNRNSNSSTPPIGDSHSCSSASSCCCSSSTSSMEDDQETPAGEFPVRRPVHQQHHCVTIMTVQKYEWHRACHHVSSASTTAAAAAAGFNNNRDPLRLSSDQRHQRLLEVGYTSQDIFKATNTASKSKRVRDRSNQQVPFDHMHLLVERTVRRVCKLSTIFRRSKNRRKLKQQQQTQVAHTTNHYLSAALMVRSRTLFPPEL